MDRKLYKKHMHEALRNCPNLVIQASSVFDLVLNHPTSTPEYPRSEIRGVKLGGYLLSLSDVLAQSGVPSDTGEVITCSQVVICTGTFLSGEIHIGKINITM